MKSCRASLGEKVGASGRPSFSSFSFSSASSSAGASSRPGRRAFTVGSGVYLLASLFPSSRARSQAIQTGASDGEGESASGRSRTFFTNFMRNPGMQARKLVQEGMRSFLDGDVKASVAKFDQALALDPSYKPKLWQRGLSLYYAGKYAEAAEQFRCDVAYNPNDTEEALWTYLSEAQMVGPQKARENFLKVGKDPRPLLRTVYDVFRSADITSPDEILNFAEAGYSAHDEFYSKLYAGLWYESMGKEYEEDAKKFVLASVETRYALQSGDYMCGLAEVHCKVRKWI